MMVIPLGMISRFLSALGTRIRLGLILDNRSVCSIEDRIVTAEFTGGEAVVFDAEDRRAYLLNHTAALVLGLIDGNRSVGEIARRIASDFGKEEGVVARDVRRIFRHLFLKGVLQMAYDRSYVPRMKSETVVRAEDDGAFIFDPLTDQLAAINETGRIVVEEIDGKKSVADIVKKVRSVFPDQVEGEIRTDVESFLDELRNRGFLAA